MFTPKTPWLRIIKRGAAKDLTYLLLNLLYGLAECLLTLAEVCT